MSGSGAVTPFTGEHTHKQKLVNTTVFGWILLAGFWAEDSSQMAFFVPHQLSRGVLVSNQSKHG
jgi:hypothetical protein